ncbi:MAG: proline iminopeptidase-family hydrolase [Dehalococcoidia bacterium]
MSVATQKEGFVEAPGGRVWYRIAGDGPGVPLLILHGGPGAGHDYLEPLEALGDERPVVFYDQLGCGKSDIPDDLSLWTMERFVREVDSVRKALGLEKVHILGQSWGGWMAIEYLLGKPAGVASVVLANTSASAAGFAREAAKLVAGLPEDTQETIRRCEAEGKFDDPMYQVATFAFYQKHLCRLPMPWPDAILRTIQNTEKTPVYGYMWGPSEFTMTGTLGSWDRSGRLGEIKIPTLVLSGEYDEAQPPLQEELRDGIPGAEMVILEDASHLAHFEQTEKYLSAVRDFLKRVEAPV